MATIPQHIENNPGSIETHGTIYNNSKIVARVGVLLSIYLTKGRHKKNRIIDILKNYMDIFREQVTHFQSPNSRKLVKWNEEKFTKIYQGSMSDETLPLHILLKHQSVSEPDDPSYYYLFISCKGKSDLLTPLSGLKAYFPPLWVFEKPTRFVDLVNDWCDRLAPEHGSCGLGDLTTTGDEVTEPWHFPLLKRYPGLGVWSRGVVTLS